MMKSTPQEQLFQFKKQVVQWAQIHGIKPAVRKWSLGRNTIRRWQRRFEEEGNKGLYDKRKGPKTIPHKTPLSIVMHWTCCSLAQSKMWLIMLGWDGMPLKEIHIAPFWQQSANN